jgi:hypothetical protein
MTTDGEVVSAAPRLTGIVFFVDLDAAHTAGPRHQGHP